MQMNNIITRAKDYWAYIHSRAGSTAAYKCIIGKSRTSQDFPLVGTQRSNYALASGVCVSLGKLIFKYIIE